MSELGTSATDLVSADVIIDSDEDGCYTEVGLYQDGDVYVYVEGEGGETLRYSPEQAHRVMSAIAAVLATY